MAVTQLGVRSVYAGLKSDTKPVTSLDGKVGTGATFIETDTGREFFWDGYRWTLHAEDANLGVLLRAVLEEIQELKEVCRTMRDMHAAVVAEL